MPVALLILLINATYSQAVIIAPAGLTLGVTAAVCDDKAMDHYLAEQGDK